MAIDMMSVRRELFRKTKMNIPFFHSDYICFNNMLELEEELYQWTVPGDDRIDSLGQLEEEIEELWDKLNEE